MLMRPFEAIDAVYIFRFAEGRIAHVWGIEDMLKRLEYLGLR
jgi:hypothetical protein